MGTATIHARDPFGLTGSFSWEGMQARYNSDLANDFGTWSRGCRWPSGTSRDRPYATLGGELTDAERALDVTYSGSSKA